MTRRNLWYSDHSRFELVDGRIKGTCAVTSEPIVARRVFYHAVS